MRLNDFINKKPVVKTTQVRTPIVVQNDAKVQQLQTRINELEAQLQNQSELSEQRDSAIRKKVSVEEEQSLIRNEHDESLHRITLLENTVTDYEKRLARIPPLEEELRSQISRADQIQNDLMESIKSNQQISSDKDTLDKQVIGLLDENKDLTLSEEQATKNLLSLSDEFKAIKNSYEELETFATDVSKIKQELEKEVFEVRDNRNFWHKEAEEAKIQVEQTAVIEDRLRNWITKLEKDDTSSRKKSSTATSIVKKLKQTITEMGDTIDSLMKERNFIQKENAKYREELSRPRYLSMGSIMAREGFSMPTGQENLRTKYLGTGRPTLLKFKKSGEPNDNETTLETGN